MLLVFFGQFSHYAPYLSLRVTHTPKYIIVLRFGHMLAKCRWFYSHKRTSERKNMKHVIYDKQKYKFQHPKNEWLLGSCCYTLAFWCKEMAANIFATKDAWSPKKTKHEPHTEVEKKRWNAKFYREKWPRQWLSTIPKFVDHYYTSSSIFHCLTDQLVFTNNVYTIEFHAQTQLNIQPPRKTFSTLHVNSRKVKVSYKYAIPSCRAVHFVRYRYTF